MGVGTGGGGGGAGGGSGGGGKKTVNDTHQRWRLICFRVGTDAFKDGYAHSPR